MKIGFYSDDMLYRISGTGSYTAYLVSVVQHIFKDAQNYFITECYHKDDAIDSKTFIDNTNVNYGTSLQYDTTSLILIKADRSSRMQSFFTRKRIENASKKFDLFFYCARGNYITKAKKNIAIIHFPMERLTIQKQRATIFTKIRMVFKDKRFADVYSFFLPNSDFTKGFLERYWPTIDKGKIVTVYPPVSKIPFLETKKENQILVCSRFEKSKKLEILISAFKSSAYLCNNFKLVIAGGLTKELKHYEEELDNLLSDGCNIELIANASRNEIIALYSRSKIFWHAKGYAIDENEEPYQCEHFGIPTVEAMSAGCVPIVINKGGQKEIVTPSCGFLWNTTEELVSHTEEIAQNPELLQAMAQKAIERSEYFSLSYFEQRLKTILERL